jgi:PST family polysaccharide transporter
MTFFCAPVFAVLAATGQDVIVILLGPHWAPAGPLLCVFGVRGITNSIERTMGWLHVVAGRTDRWMRWGVFSAMCQLAALAAGLPFGAMGVAIAYTVAMFCLYLPAVVYSGQPLGIGVRDVLSATAPQVVSALVAVAAALTIQNVFFMDLGEIARFLLTASTCLAIYLAVVLGVFRQIGPVSIAGSLLREMGSPKRWA